MDSVEDTFELHFSIDSGLNEQLIAELDAIGCEGFLEEESGLKAYISVSLWNAAKADVIAEWLQNRQLKPSWREERIIPQDWNASWERSIEPILVPPFYIRPGWADPHPSDGHIIDIVIDPKMSFGTGHHESTRLALRSMLEITMSGACVMDAGAGTAILSIAAAKLGASAVIAFDIDPWACENAAENIERNNVSDRVDFRKGSIDVVPERNFDAILANINRSVLLAYMPAFADRLQDEGALVLAGLLVTDKYITVRATELHGMVLESENREGEWWSGRFRKA